LIPGKGSSPGTAECRAFYILRITNVKDQITVSKYEICERAKNVRAEGKRGSRTGVIRRIQWIDQHGFAEGNGLWSEGLRSFFISFAGEIANLEGIPVRASTFE
jgi:hypothetical protein